MYAVVELQKNDTLSALISTYMERNVAEQAYHNTLAYAAVSTIPVHSVILLSDEGRTIKMDSYTHETLTEKPE